MVGGNIDKLKGYINEPFIQRAILEVLDKATTPLCARDIAERSGYKLHEVCRAMPRLHDRGLVNRWKLPLTRRHVSHGKHGFQTMRVNVYVIAGDGE